MRLAIIDFLKRGEDADVSSVSSARRIAASANEPNSVTKSAPSSPVADRTTSKHSPSALRANGPSRRAAARSTGFVNLGHFCFAGTLADISTIGPRSSTRPALTTSETDDATSSGARAEGGRVMRLSHRQDKVAFQHYFQMSLGTRFDQRRQIVRPLWWTTK